MSDEHGERIAGPSIVASAASDKQPPAWIVEATILLQAWRHDGLLARLRDVRWARPSHRYVLLDVVLVLLLVAVSDARGLRAFYRAIAGYEPALAALWGRDRLLTRSGLLGALRALDDDVLAACATLFCPT